VAFFEWNAIAKDIKQAPTWKDRLGYVFGPPGWSHDGSRKTSKQMKLEWQQLKEQQLRP
jgi:hypothetical protein